MTVRGARLYYGVGPPQPLHEGTGGYRRDVRGRVALEAFAGLPIVEMYARLDAERARVAAGATPDPEAEERAFRELLDFVRAFGPLGLDWPRVRDVENPEADRLLSENGALRAATRGLFDQGGADWESADRPPEWRVRLSKADTLAKGRVERVVSYQALPWQDRIRVRDDGLPHDDLDTVDVRPLSTAHADLLAALRLADALARWDAAAVRDLVRERTLVVPAAWGWDLPPGARSWKGRAGSREGAPTVEATPSARRPPEDEDWLARGRSVLAGQLTRELADTSVGIAVRVDAFALGWRIGSLVEVIYLQLLEHLQRHPDFGIGTCGFCGMPILRVRRGQRFHGGCGPAGRQRDSRAARRSRAQAPGSEA